VIGLWHLKTVLKTVLNIRSDYEYRPCESAVTYMRIQPYNNQCCSSAYRTGPLIAMMEAETRVVWETDNSTFLLCLLKKIWLITVSLQNDDNQSDFNKQRWNVHTIICLSLHACPYPHYCHHPFISPFYTSMAKISSIYRMD